MRKDEVKRHFVQQKAENQRTALKVGESLWMCLVHLVRLVRLVRLVLSCIWSADWCRSAATDCHLERREDVRFLSFSSSCLVFHCMISPVKVELRNWHILIIISVIQNTVFAKWLVYLSLSLHLMVLALGSMGQHQRKKS